ncbi:TIGR01777 family oxidoreductase [Pseudaeromonas sharmana]|uniref:TIGR01777 family oxidoreductase n=1 Tax=Pseudaeromonas sharmana TaxID=328412 RepID=A0ABV8CRU9_9GAMM
MQILITGATGFIGQHLVAALSTEHQLTVISRRRDKAERLFAEQVQVRRLDELNNLDAFDVIINLAGEPIADRYWTTRHKERIAQSRWLLTEALQQKLAVSQPRPRLWLNASAIGFYGQSDANGVNEYSPVAQPDFAHQVCQRWEQLATMAAEHQCRVCLLRLGIVLGKEGGVLQRLLPLYRLGLGSQLGSGKQFISWIAIDDVIAAIQFLLTRHECHGAYNLTTPYPVSQLDFSRQLARSVQRPHWLWTPAWLLRLLLGERAALLINGPAVYPQRLQEAGFTFAFPELSQALHHVLGGAPVTGRTESGPSSANSRD